MSPIPVDEFDVFFSALRAADEEYATAVALNLLDAGNAPRRVLLELIGAAQREVGARWQSGSWSVAEEHAATAVNERVVAAVGARTRNGDGRRNSRGSVLLGCVEGEWHVLPAMLVAEVPRLDGWEVDLLGASVPTETLVARIHQYGPDVVALSCSRSLHLPVAHRAITAARQTGTPVLVGGPGFGPGGRWATLLGADAWAADAADAATLLAERPLAMPTGLDAAGPGRAPGEHPGLRARRAELLRTASGAFESAADAPARRDPGLADELGNLIDHLAASAYLGDQQPFLDQVRWQTGLLVERRASPEPVGAVLRALRDELHDFPFAQGCLDGALGHLEPAARAEGVS